MLHLNQTRLGLAASLGIAGLILLVARGHEPAVEGQYRAAPNRAVGHASSCQANCAHLRRRVAPKIGAAVSHPDHALVLRLASRSSYTYWWTQFPADMCAHWEVTRRLAVGLSAPRATSQATVAKTAKSSDVVLVCDTHDVSNCIDGLKLAVEWASDNVGRPTVFLEAIPPHLAESLNSLPPAPRSSAEVSANLGALDWPWDLSALGEVLASRPLCRCTIRGLDLPRLGRSAPHSTQLASTIQVILSAESPRRRRVREQNSAWLELIAEEAESGSPVVVFVGLVHVLGFGGLGEALSARGFSVSVIVPFEAEWERRLWRNWSGVPSWLEVASRVYWSPLRDSRLRTLRGEIEQSPGDPQAVEALRAELRSSDSLRQQMALGDIAELGAADALQDEIGTHLHSRDRRVRRKAIRALTYVHRVNRQLWDAIQQMLMRRQYPDRFRLASAVEFLAEWPTDIELILTGLCRDEKMDRRLRLATALSLGTRLAGRDCVAPLLLHALETNRLGPHDSARALVMLLRYEWRLRELNRVAQRFSLADSDEVRRAAEFVRASTERERPVNHVWR